MMAGSYPAREPRVVLCTGGLESVHEFFLTSQWQKCWDDVQQISGAAFLEGKSHVVSIAPGDSLPVINNSSLILFLTEQSQLKQALVDQTRWMQIVFEPSRLALLDELRQRRPTLIAVRTLQAGTRLGDEDLGFTEGGTGIGFGLKKHVVNHTLLYDLPGGSDITFGHVDIQAPLPATGSGINTNSDVPTTKGY